VTRDGALARIAAFGADAAVVFGSGLAGLPHGAEVEAEIGYPELGWPCTRVPGHANLVRLARVPLTADGEAAGPARDASSAAAAGGGELRLALACGRPHRYEGWSEADLARPVADLAGAGVGRLVLTNACGALRPAVRPGDVVSCSHVVDLQAPGDEPERLAVCDASQAAAVAAAVGSVAAGRVRTGVYVAVAGPQFETPAEVEWLAAHGDVVGMSAAPELRAARATGASCCLLGLVANRAAAVGSHDDVLAVGAMLAGALAAALPAAVLARWPAVARGRMRGAEWTS
jgi:purine nucleoside phosphorylase